MNIKYLDQMFPTEEKKMIFLGKCILTFGLRLDGLSEILKMDKNELYKKIMNNNREIDSSLIMVFNHGMKNQDKAKNDFLSFYDRLCKACLEKNKDKISEVLEILSDKKALEIKKRLKIIKDSEKNEPVRLTDEEVLMILRYQIKYMTNPSIIENMFRIDRTSYSKRVRKLWEKYPMLVSYFDYLCDLYHQANMQKRGL